MLRFIFIWALILIITSIICSTIYKSYESSCNNAFLKGEIQQLENELEEARKNAVPVIRIKYGTIYENRDEVVLEEREYSEGSIEK